MTDAMNAVTNSTISPIKNQQSSSSSSSLTSSPSNSNSSSSTSSSSSVNGPIVGPSSVSPRKFRKEVGLLRDQFAGDDQHDAQELLAFLLDGLSEDLNLVREKPYIEQPDSDERPDHILADIW
eukprot:CAMPEP_0174823010 /NCGR_PEP_ID=MMETSP1107-20130205/20598_1 /TAXON_ID=36770 /ORGANISM="Paraphysomonas vestita, Strain GFlagA" /LENGTH=122 /DNA_ID=CAMNT_0016043849 /DNA_START=293 /DNA_END=658 /DNA_ORIENTATION=-